MKPISCVFFSLPALLAFAAGHLPAADSSAAFSYVVKDPELAAVRAADDARVTAARTRDRAQLAAVLADELRYAHSSGIVDTKESYIDSIVSGRSVYDSYDYEERVFKPVAPGVVLMTGRVLIQSRNADGPLLIDLNFLAVWRNENGVWRFLAWQSCRNPPPPSPPPPA
jgi:hypothetical protein